MNFSSNKNQPQRPQRFQQIKFLVFFSVTSVVKNFCFQNLATLSQSLGQTETRDLRSPIT